jgi:hypothetical protein
MTSRFPISSFLSSALQAEVRRYCKRHKLRRADLVRAAVAEKIGKPELAEMRPQGRPPKKRDGKPT